MKYMHSVFAKKKMDRSTARAALHACAARPDRIHLYRLSTTTNMLHAKKNVIDVCA